MEDLIYVLFFVIYIVFAILKKVMQKKAIDKNTSPGTSEPAPGPVKGIFARLEEIQRQQEMAARQAAEPQESTQEEETPAPYSAPQQQEKMPVPAPEPVTTYSDELDEYAAQKKFTYDDYESLEQKIPEAVSLSDLSVKKKKGSLIKEEEYYEPAGFGFSFMEPADLQKAFVWKEVFDKPIALRR